MIQIFDISSAEDITWINRIMIFILFCFAYRL